MYYRYLQNDFDSKCAPAVVFGGDELGSLTPFVSISGIDDEDEVTVDLHLSGVLESLESFESLRSNESLTGLVIACSCFGCWFVVVFLDGAVCPG